jgi:transposase
MTEADWTPLVKEWFPHLTDTRLRQVTWADFDKHREYIAEMLRAGVSKATIHQRLRDEHGVSGSVASFKRYVAANLAEDAVRSKVTVLRDDPDPGLEAQIDYGMLGSWTDPRTGRSQRIWAFVMVLSHSRHMFVRPVISMDQASWTASHVEAFAFFGGAPARLVPDNLKTGVDKPDLYDPKLNRAYAELAAHYGVLIDPARARKPKDKPRVERQMPYIRDSWWKGREFASLAEMQASALHWCREVAGQRKHRGLDGRTPAEVFDQAEAGTLTPLPASVFTMGGVGASQGRPGRACEVRQSALLRALEADRAARRHPCHGDDGADLPQRRVGEDPCPQGQRPSHGRRGLPAGKDRLPHADADVVPGTRRADRAGDCGGRR